MSFIVFMLILVSSPTWCASAFPINQHPADSQQNGDNVEHAVELQLNEQQPPNNVKDPSDGVKTLSENAPKKEAAAKEPDIEKHKSENAPDSNAGEKKPNIADKKQAEDSVHKDSEDAASTKQKENTELKSHKKFNRPNSIDMDSSTPKRLILVLVGLSVLFIMYLAFRTCRQGKRRGPIIVSKYGVRTRRSDLEMRPLPLDEDDDDETVFDLGNINTR